MTLTIYSWQFSNSNECLAYLVAFHIWNSFRYTNNNGKSTILYHDLTISNIGSTQVNIKMGLISNIENETTILWYIITKTVVLSTLEIAREVGNDINDGYRSIKLFFTTPDREFTSHLVNDIKSSIGSYEPDFIK